MSIHLTIAANAVAAERVEMALDRLVQVLGECWQPMHTAPKSWVGADGMVNGEYLLGYIPPGPGDEPYCDAQVGITVLWWEPRMGPAGCWYDGVVVCHPTHWMPLPAAPAPVCNG